MSFVAGLYLYFYSEMPEQMASHWNVQGEVDGYMSKFLGLFLMPIVLLGMFLLFLIIPKIDPLKANIEKFRKYFDWFILAITLFMLYVYALTILWSMDKRFNMTLALIPAFALLFYYLGIMVGNAKRNWFIGIRTPWTLSNEKVWDKTHKLASKLFRMAAVIVLAGIFFPKYGIWFLLVPILVASLYPVVYSYFEYRKEEKLK